MVRPTPAPPPAIRELPPCKIEREGLAKRDSTLRFSPECLPLLGDHPDLDFVKRLELIAYGAAAAWDLSPLAKLGALEDLTLRLDPLPRLDALAKLPALRRVRILNPLETFDALVPLTQIHTLHFAPPTYKALKDVAALAKLTALSELSLRCEIDLSALVAARPQLLVLVAPGATRLEVLASFTELKHLTLGCFESNSVRLPAPPKLDSLSIQCHDGPLPLGPVVSFPNLTALDISETEARALGPVGKLAKLKHLDAHATQIRDLAPLAQCHDLEWIDLHDAPLASLSPLGKLPRLVSIDAGNTPITTLAPLSGAKSLHSLWLPGARVTSVLPLAHVPALTEVMVPRHCSSRDVLALHRARPQLKIMAWVEKSQSADPTCF